MHILFVSQWYPWPLNLGGNIRRYHLVRHLAERHDVTLVTMMGERREGAEGFPPSPLPEMCREVRIIDVRDVVPKARINEFAWFAPLKYRLRNLLTWPLSLQAGPFTAPEVVREFVKLRRDVQADAVWVDRSYIAEGMRAAGFERMTVDLDDVMALMQLRELRHCGWYKSKPLHYAQVAKTAWYERTLARRFERLAVCKEEDRRFIGNSRGNVYVVPNGTTMVAPYDPAREVANQMLFVGAFNYEPNEDAVRHFAWDILPVIQKMNSQAKFIAVGRTPEPELLRLANGKDIEIVGNAISLEPHYEQASIIVCPLRRGGGTKLKVLEALARGKALVATSHSVEGFNLRPGVDFELADRPDAFAAACCRLLADAEQRKRLGESGRARIAQKFSWEAVGNQAEEALGLTQQHDVMLKTHPIVA